MPCFAQEIEHKALLRENSPAACPLISLLGPYFLRGSGNLVGGRGGLGPLDSHESNVSGQITIKFLNPELFRYFGGIPLTFDHILGEFPTGNWSR